MSSGTRKVTIGGEGEDVYIDGEEIVISGFGRLYADEAVDVGLALLELGRHYERVVRNG